MSDALLRAVVQLIRPLVKAMIDGGITYPVFAEHLRKTYVEVARSAYGMQGKPLSNSRITVITGVHRKQIKRLGSETAPDQTPVEKMSLSARVIANWCSNPEFLDENEHPMALPRVSASGQPSLERLVASVSVDVRPGALLAEWLRSGIIELQGDKVKLITTALMPRESFEEKAYHFGRNLREHIAAGAHNLSEAPPLFFDRAVYYDRISPESVEELRSLCARRGEELLIEINRKARKLAKRDHDYDQPKGRMTFGAYFFGKDDIEDE